MPYTVSNPPEAVKALPKHAIEIFVAAFNSALGQYKGNEARAMMVAWAAVKTQYKQDADGKWVKLEEEKLETVNIENVEILAVGKWEGYPDGAEYKAKDLDELVKAFDALTGDNSLNYEPPVKLGHDEKQKLLQTDGYPAAGWVSKLKKVGDKLVASFRDVPKGIGDIIKAGGYKKISSEIYSDYSSGGHKFPLVLKAVALLGADIPAVKTIADIQALYTEEEGTNVAVVFYQAEKAAINKEKEKQEEHMEELEAIRELLGLGEGDSVLEAVKALKAKADKVGEVEKEKLTSLAERQAIEAKVTVLEKKVAASEQLLAERERDDRVAKAIRAGKITPAQKPSAETYALSDPSGFDTFMASQPVVVKFGELGKPGNEGGTEEVPELTLKYAERMGNVVSKEDLLKAIKVDKRQ